MSITSAGQRQRSVADPSSVYESMKPLWSKARAIIGGERFTKEYDGYLDTVNFSNLLLPFSPSMTAAQYAFYRSEAELPGIVSQYVKILIGGLLRKQPQLTLPKDAPEEAYDWIMSAFSQSGAPLVGFLDDCLREELQTSRAWIYVDYPVIASPENLSRDEQLAIKPYPVLWNAESIINWKQSTDTLTGKQSLNQIIIRGYDTSYDYNEFHPVFLDTVRVHEIVNGYYQIRKFQRQAEDSQIMIVQGKLQQDYKQSVGGTDPKLSEYELVETNTNILMHGERLTFIPAWPLNGSVSIVEPMLMTLINKEIALYNKISRRNHLLYGAATYTPVIASDMSDDDFDRIVSTGLGSWIRLRQGDSATVLETPTGALTDLDRSIVSALDEMAKIGVRMLAPDDSQSGVALDIRNAGQTAQLGTLNTKAGNQFASIIAFMINWRYGTQLKSTDIGFELSADFNPTPMGSDYLRMFTEFYEKGFVPRDEWLNMLKQNDLLSPDYDDVAGQASIVKDELIFTSRENTDYSMQQAAEQKALAESQRAEEKALLDAQMAAQGA